jgi:hypothetical protein
MPLCRSIIYLNQRNYAPESIRYQQKLNQMIDGDVLAKRLGLICFELKQDLVPTHQYTIKNDTELKRWIKAKQFENEYFKPLQPQQIVFMMDAKTEVSLEITFSESDFSSSARYSLIEGYRLQQTEDSLRIEFESVKKDSLSKKGLIEKIQPLFYTLQDFKRILKEEDEKKEDL